MTTMNITTISGRAVTFSVAGTPSGAASLQVQYANRWDFNLCIAPLAPLSVVSSFTFAPFNQDDSYYFRIRALNGSGLPMENWSSTIGLRIALVTPRDTSVPALVIDKALIVPPEPVLVWTGTGDVAGYPARCMGRDDPTSAWWSTGSSGAHVFQVTTGGGPVDTISILDTNANEEATISITADPTLSGLNGGSPAYTSATMPFRASANLSGRRGYHSLVRLPSPIAYRHMQVTINVTVPSDIFVATYAIFGLARITRNYSQGKTEQIEDQGTLSRGRFGNPVRALGHRMRKVDFDVSQITTEMHEDQYSQIGRIVGLTEPALVVPNSKVGGYLHDRLLYGAITANKNAAANALGFTDSFTVDSLINA